MKKEMEYFVWDLVKIINSLYEESLRKNDTGTLSSENIDFNFGSAAGYYEIIQIIEQLLIELGYSADIKEGIISKNK